MRRIIRGLNRRTELGLLEKSSSCSRSEQILIAGGNATGSESTATYDPERVEFSGHLLFDPFRVRNGINALTVGLAHGYLIQPLRGCSSV